MGLSVCSFASGSSGNCYLVRGGRTTILIDAGISNKKITDFLKDAGVGREEVDGVFVTHEHTDHTKGLRVLTRKNPGWKIYSSTGTAPSLQDMIHGEDRLICFEAGSEIRIGDLAIRSIPVSHDAADPVCYTVASGGTRLTILTDTGCITRQAAETLCHSEIIILESNHEVNMLRAGPYPYSLKRRILGDRGHLSNEDAGQILAETMQKDRRFRHILLAHLSSRNNFPGLAFQTVKNILEENGFYMDRDFRLEVIRREGISGVTELSEHRNPPDEVHDYE